MIVKRIHFYNQPAGTGGGGGPTAALVAWGPDFGGADGDQFMVGAHINIPSLAMVHAKTVGAQITMPAVGLAHDKSVGAQMTGTALGAPFQIGAATTTTQTATSATIDIAKPADSVAGDLLVCGVGCSNTLGAADTYTAPAGWTQIQQTQSAGTIRAALATFYRVVDGSEGASFTFTCSAARSNIGWMILYRGVDATTPLNTSGASTGNTADPVLTAITTTAINCAIVSAVAQANALAASYTPQAGYVEQADQNGTASGVSSVTSQCMNKVQAASGSTGTTTHNSSQTLASQWVGHLFAIAPGTVTLQ